MSKELECLKRIDTKNYLTEREHKEFLGVVEKALKEYEAIDNSNPSEALECVEDLIFNFSVDEYVDRYDNNLQVIKQALLKAQEPKHYLKWEDLEFKNYDQVIFVLLNGNKYLLKYYINDMSEKVHAYKEDKNIFLFDGKYQEDRQFFNDLHLERVEE